MSELFYALVETITERITGIENGAMTLLELPTYLSVSQDVTLWCNIAIALVIPVLVIGIIGVYKFSSNMIKKLYCSEKAES